MAGARFRFKASLPGLPGGAERPIIEQFRSLQANVDNAQGVERNTPPVFEGSNIQARVGQLIRLSPPAGGTLVMIPPGDATNITQSIWIAVVAGILSPGATVSIVGRKGTINGQQTLPLNTYRLVELKSCGELGWFYST